MQSSYRSPNTHFSQEWTCEAALFGSKRCFDVAISNGVKIVQSVVVISIEGDSLSIINQCLEQRIQDKRYCNKQFESEPYPQLSVSGAFKYSIG